jgi:2-phospho-L-lactate guanylyltransferase
MDCWAIIPVKAFALGKSRLAPVLGGEPRTALNRALFGGVLDAALGVFRPDRIIVVTSDAALPGMLRGKDIHTVADPPGGLNAALGVACRHAIDRAARAIVVLASDLPLVAPGDVAALVAALDGEPRCVIAPDRHDKGTNALALAPPTADFFRFGPDSFHAHTEAAAARGMRMHVLRRPGLAHDLDTPDDYRTYANAPLVAARATA